MKTSQKIDLAAFICAVIVTLIVAFNDAATWICILVFLLVFGVISGGVRKAIIADNLVNLNDKDRR